LSLPSIPLADLDLALARGVRACAVLLTVVPVAIVLTTVWPDENAFALLLVIVVEADVLSTIIPREGSLAMHLIVFPFAFVHAFVSPFIFSEAMDVVLAERPIITRVIRPAEPALAVLLTVLVSPNVSGTVWPVLVPGPVLLIFDPHALVMCTVSVVINSIAVSLVVLPFSYVNISIRVDKATFTVCFVLFEVTFV
jgi:hypothetical protein